MDLAQACTREVKSGPLNRNDPDAPNYSPSGVYGDPQLASREKGEILVQAMLEDLLMLLK
ncbi:MAG: creatininase family protein [Gammaproteobacteria bacterium]|nr:creatininase family protein [Gammaproteobacteria bacterium]